MHSEGDDCHKSNHTTREKTIQFLQAFLDYVNLPLQETTAYTLASRERLKTLLSAE